MNFVFGFPKQGNLISIKYDEKLQIAEIFDTFVITFLLTTLEFRIDDGSE